jgi:hypothetical protein
MLEPTSPLSLSPAASPILPDTESDQFDADIALPMPLHQLVDAIVPTYEPAGDIDTDDHAQQTSYRFQRLKKTSYDDGMMFIRTQARISVGDGGVSGSGRGRRP